MNEYQEQAFNFLKECEATLQITFSHVGKNENWCDKELREIYTFIITTPLGSYCSFFYDSVYNYKQKQKAQRVIKNHAYYNDMKTRKDAMKYYEHVPSAYDILACLQGYLPPTFEDFCSDYGYDTDSIRALKTYLECQKEYEGLRKIFTREQLEKLNEIS